MAPVKRKRKDIEINSATSGSTGQKKTKRDSTKKADKVQVLRQHPLQIYVVLEHLFKWSTGLWNVKRNRLVCRSWLKASAAQWEKLTKTLTIYQFEKNMANQGGSNNQANILLQELEQRCLNTKTPLDDVLPYRSFKLQNWLFDNQLIDTLLSCSSMGLQNSRIHLKYLLPEQWFWSNIAPEMVTKLTLNNCEFPEGLVVFGRTFLKVFPSLKILTVSNCLVKDSTKYQSDSEHKHENLKALAIKMGGQFWDWEPVLEKLPKLQHLCVRGDGLPGDQDWELFLNGLVRWDLRHVKKSLKYLDLLDFAEHPFSRGTLCDPPMADFLALDVFKYDLGYLTSSVISNIGWISRRMEYLKELHLYQAPMRLPPTNFMAPAEMPCLRKLYLWGTFDSTMEFLNSVPNLEVLVWVTSAYDMEHHGKRLFKVWTPEQNIYPLCNWDFLEESETLPVLEKLTDLELDWAPKSAISWSKLATCMPHLTSLKVKVATIQQLLQIQQHCTRLQNLELAHGSFVNGKELIRALTKFDNLRSFIWKACLCTNQLVDVDEIVILTQLENSVRAQLPFQFEFPWHYEQVENELALEQKSWKTPSVCSIDTKMCIRGRYEKALETKNPLVYTFQ